MASLLSVYGTRQHTPVGIKNLAGGKRWSQCGGFFHTSSEGTLTVSDLENLYSLIILLLNENDTFFYSLAF